MLQAISAMIQEDRKEKLVVSISNISTDIWLEVNSKLKLAYNIVKELRASAPKKTVPAYDWTVTSERTQSVRLTAGSAFSAFERSSDA